MKKSDLDQFIGSQHFYNHWTRAFIFTDGIKYVADKGGAYWLIDAIASWQGKLKTKVTEDQYAFQVWELEVNDDKSARLTCRDDDRNILVIQDIEFTDFPMKKITLWLTDETLLLPSEW